jgi:hypothetical protein
LPGLGVPTPMAKTISLTNFRAAVRRRYDGENLTNRHPDALIDELANSGYRSLRSFVTGCGYDAFLTSTTATTTGSPPAAGETYEEINYPSGAISIRGVDVFDSPVWRPLSPIGFVNRRSWPDRTNLPEGFTIALAGSVSGSTYTPGKIQLFPLPRAGLTVKVWYLPEFADISSGTDVFLYQDEDWLQYHIYWVMNELGVRDAADDPTRLQIVRDALDPERRGSLANRIRDLAPRVIAAGPRTMRRSQNYYG